MHTVCCDHLVGDDHLSFLIKRDTVGDIFAGKTTKSEINEAMRNLIKSLSFDEFRLDTHVPFSHRGKTQRSFLWQLQRMKNMQDYMHALTVHWLVFLSKRIPLSKSPTTAMKNLLVFLIAIFGTHVIIADFPVELSAMFRKAIDAEITHTFEVMVFSEDDVERCLARKLYTIIVACYPFGLGLYDITANIVRPLGNIVVRQPTPLFALKGIARIVQMTDHWFDDDLHSDLAMLVTKIVFGFQNEWDYVPTPWHAILNELWAKEKSPTTGEYKTAAFGEVVKIVAFRLVKKMLSIADTDRRPDPEFAILLRLVIAVGINHPTFVSDVFELFMLILFLTDHTTFEIDVEVLVPDDVHTSFVNASELRVNQHKAALAEHITESTEGRKAFKDQVASSPFNPLTISSLTVPEDLPELDVTIEVEDPLTRVTECFPSCSFLLGRKSSFFRNAFSEKWKRDGIIKVTLALDGFAIFNEWALRDHLDLSTSNSEVIFRLLDVALFLGVPTRFIRTCERRLISIVSLQPSNKLFFVMLEFLKVVEHVYGDVLVMVYSFFSIGSKLQRWEFYSQ